MVCSKCNSSNDDNAKFCNNCGIQLINEIECSDCKTINPLSSKFCKNCGKELLTKELIKQKTEVVLNNEFAIKLGKIYNEKILERINKFGENVNKDIHFATRLFNSKNFKKEYSYSVKKCFDYLIESSKKVLSKEHIKYIKEKQDTFLSNDSESLFSLLNDLDEEIESVIQNIQNSSGFSEFLKGGAKGIAIAANGILTRDIIGGVKSFADVFSDYDKIDSKAKSAWSDFDDSFLLVIDEFETMWGKLCDLFEEIAKNTPIRIEIDEVALEKQKEEDKKIQTIIENNLKGKASFYLHPDIPAEKKSGAMSTYLNIVDSEQLICLYDSTFFGGAKEGICFTTHAVYWKNSSDGSGSFKYDAINKIEFNKEDLLLINDDRYIARYCTSQVQHVIKKTLDEIVDYLKSRDTN